MNSKVFRGWIPRVAVLLCFGGTMPAYPWNATGHQVVALIAWQRLSPEVQQRIEKLLFDGRYTLRDIAACADQIRGGVPRPGARAYPVDPACNIVAGKVAGNTGPWHYIDIPLPLKDKNLAAYCPKGDCIVDQIEREEKVLRESNNDAERRQALLFLVHFLGDIHQPLHAVERGCDRGGNLERVNFYLGEEERANEPLHNVWDSAMLDWLMRDQKLADEQAVAADLEGRIDDDEAAGWSRATVPQIAWESYRLAKKKAYRGIPVEDFCGVEHPKPGKATNLTRGYESSGARAVREQLMKAGVRLAAALERNVK